MSDWLDEEAGVLTPVEEFQSKLKILKEMAAPVMARLREHRERPEALDVLKQSLNSSKVFLEKSRWGFRDRFACGVASFIDYELPNIL